MKLGKQVGLGPGHIVLDGDKSLPPPKGQSVPPIFGPYLLWSNGSKVGLDPSDIVLDEDPVPPSPERDRAAPQFSAHVCCGQTAAWTKVPIGMKVGLGPGYIVLDGDPAPLPKRGLCP